MLLAIDSGRLHEFRGKNLDDIDISGMERCYCTSFLMMKRVIGLVALICNADVM